MVMTFSVIMYCVFRGQPGCPGGLRAVTHAQSFCAFDMEKGNKSQMPTDIHKHMAHRTDLALCVCVYSQQSYIHKGFRCDLSVFPVAIVRASPGQYVYHSQKFTLKTIFF